MTRIFVFTTRQILHSLIILSYICLSGYFDSVLILCNIFVELEHFILFNNLDKYHNFYLLQDKHKINGS